MAFSTKLNLIDQKFEQTSNGTLTLSGGTRIADSGTLQYLTDQSGAYVARSLVDAAYVSGLTNGLETRVEDLETWSGTTEIRVDNLETWSGATDTIIDGIESDIQYLSGQTDTKLAILDFDTYSGATDSRLGMIESAATALDVRVDDLEMWSGLTDTTIDGIQSDIQYISGQTDTKLAIVDFETYSGATDTRIDNLEIIGDVALTGATNGLTKVGRDVILGGALTGDTTICGGGAYSLNLGAGGYELQDFSVRADNLVQISGGLVTQIVGDGSQLYLTGTEIGINSGNTAFRGMVYCNDYSANFQPHSLVDKAYVTDYVTGLTSQAILTANNGLTKTGQNVTLGGALTEDTTICGNHDLNIRVTEANLSGSTGVNLTGEIRLKTTPADFAGDVLTFDPSDGSISKTTLSSLGGITGGTNGLHAVGQNVLLGGVLTETTNLRGACLDISDVAGFNVRTSGNTDMNIDAQNCGGFLIKSQCGSINTFPDFTNAVGILGHVHEANGFAVYDNRTGSTRTGIEYADDYSANYSNRSLVDKQYVDTIATGLQVHAAALFATTEDITLSGLQSIDGFMVSAGQRILVKNQSDETENGLYLAVDGGAWTRTTDFDNSPAGEITNGDLIPVTSGLTQNNSVWVLTTLNPIVLGTSNLTFTLFSTIIDVVGGQGIDVNMTGAMHTVCVQLASNCGMTFCGSGLAVNPNISGNALSYTDGVLNVNAANCGSVGAIPVGYNAGDCLVVACADITTALGTPINAAINGLTKVGSAVRLGGTITGETTLVLNGTGSPTLAITDNRIGTAGIEYSTDYSGGFTARSLVDKGFVTGLTSSIDSDITALDGRLDVIEPIYLTGATNGLTKVGAHDVKLGGALNTWVDIATNDNDFYIHDTANVKLQLSNGMITLGKQSGTVYSYAYVDGCGSNGIGLDSVGGILCTSSVYIAPEVIQLRTISGQTNAGIFIGHDSIEVVANKTFGLFSGITYNDDYGSRFGARSLVDKGYVTGLTSSIDGDITAIDGRLDIIEPIYVTGATNGLCKTDAHTVQLGGLITEMTSIDLVGNSYLRIGDFNTGGTLNIGGPGAAPQFSYAGLSFNNGSGEYTNLQSTAGMVQFNATSGGTQKVLQFCHNNGLVYYDDYSSDFTARSLVDKAYVDGLVAASGVTASNGLTAVGQDVQLGGSLTGDTTISMSSNQLLIEGTSGNYLFQNALLTLAPSDGNSTPEISIDASADTIELSTESGLQISLDGVLSAITLTGIVNLETAPVAGEITDSVLVRASDGTVKTVSGAALGDKNNVYTFTAVSNAVELTTGSSYVILGDSTGGAFTITLPSSPISGQAFKIKDAGGDALSEPITVNGNGNNIDGGATAMINTSYGALELMWSGTEWLSLAFIN